MHLSASSNSRSPQGIIYYHCYSSCYPSCHCRQDHWWSIVSTGIDKVVLEYLIIVFWTTWIMVLILLLLTALAATSSHLHSALLLLFLLHSHRSQPHDASSLMRKIHHPPAKNNYCPNTINILLCKHEM